MRRFLILLSALGLLPLVVASASANSSPKSSDAALAERYRHGTLPRYRLEFDYYAY